MIGVQPALGVEGDPMRLLFERDLTPHPQYAVRRALPKQDSTVAHVLRIMLSMSLMTLARTPKVH